MVDDGYQDVVNIDISSVVIEQMKKKYHDKPQLKCIIFVPNIQTLNPCGISMAYHCIISCNLQTRRWMSGTCQTLSLVHLMPLLTKVLLRCNGCQHYGTSLHAYVTWHWVLNHSVICRNTRFYYGESIVAKILRYSSYAILRAVFLVL